MDTSIYRIDRQEVRFIPGTSVDAFIHNSLHYLTAIDAYADGVFDCWGGVDRDFLQRKLRSRWLVPSVPDGEPLGIHELGRLTPVQGQWRRSSEQLHAHLLATMEALNPRLEGLVDFEGSDVTLRGGVRYAKLGMLNAIPVRAGTGGPVRGHRRWLLSQREGRWWLGPVALYSDGSVDVHPEPGERELIDLPELGRRLSAGTVATAVPDQTRLCISDLGAVTVTEGRWFLEHRALLGELRDIGQELVGQQTSSQRFEDIWHDYLHAPSPEGRVKVRAAYHAVPRHRRIYLGDMDTRDTDILAVIRRKTEPGPRMLRNIAIRCGWGGEE